MATYKSIKGFKVQTLASDPLATGVAGGTWSSGGNMNVARSEFGGGGSQASGIAAGGRNATLINNIAEVYNGSSWSVISTMGTTARGRLGAGADNEAFIAIGGNPSVVNTELWNGSSWTELNNLNTAKDSIFGNMGTSTAALATGYGSPDTTVEIWDGTSWTEVADLNAGGSDASFFGTSTSGIIAGGNRPAQVASVESWNGTAWTEVADLNQQRAVSAGAGSSNLIGIIFGGSYDPVGTFANTESWNGSSWTEVADLATGRFKSGGAGSETSALCSGGYGGSPATFTGATEEFTAAQITDTIKNEGQVYYNTTSNTLKLTKLVYGTGAWSSGGALNTATHAIGFFGGTQTAAIVAGGASPPTANTELYNGSSWTETTNMPRANYYGYGLGTTQNLMIAVGGTPPVTGATTKWDGSSWSELNDLNTARSTMGGFGTTASGIIAGGSTAVTESWDGTSWSEIAELNSARTDTMSGGTSNTSGLITGGNGAVALTETWNGSSWTEVADLNTGRLAGGSSGTATSAIVFGGASPPRVAVTETWNGSSWTEVADLATARQDIAHGSSNASANTTLAASGYSGSYSAATEEWTVPATVSNVTVDVD